VPGYDHGPWNGFLAPAKTPRAIVAKLHEETTRILRRPDTQEKLHGLSMDIAASSPEQYRDFIKAQIAQWTPLVKASGALSN